MDILQYLKDNILILDGGMGTLLQEQGLPSGELPEKWNLTYPEIITKIHREYFDAGSNVVNTNTFGANILKFSISELDLIIKSAVENARVAADCSVSGQEKFVALDIGPTGKLLKPYGDFEFEDAVNTFAQTVKLGVKHGVDLIFIETMNDSLETKAAILAAKENSGLPVFVSNAYGADGKLMTGASPEAMSALLEGMGAEAIGVNCSLGPRQLEDVVKKLLEISSVPIILKPNAGLPKCENGKTVYDVSPEEFSDTVTELVKCGVRAVGGCCGTTPLYIKAIADRLKDFKPSAIEEKHITCVSSYTHAVYFGKAPVLIGERINPTGKKRFKQALVEKDIGYILNEGINQQDRGIHILDVNVGLPEIDEPEMLKSAVCELQAVIDLPLQIDTSDTVAIETALRCYNGKAMINSVNGKKESMDAIFPLVKKYGGLCVALTLDESGIPETAEGRVRIAEKILKTAAGYGISKKDIIFDTLAMAVSADKNAAKATLGALNTIKTKLGCHTVLGVSNISFGLPARDCINSTFFATALYSGLTAAIMNPYSADMMKTYYSYRALCGEDENFTDYIAFAQKTTEGAQKPLTAEISELSDAIAKGVKSVAAEQTRLLLQTVAPLDIVKDEIIPALDRVGGGFETKTVYLPQLLMSAEAAKAAFEEIKSFMLSKKAEIQEKYTFVLATVKGDIHDIGKNIVKLLMENYGYNVVDLGKDVSPEIIAEKIVETHAPLAGLSALMTTTVPAMEETIQLIREKAPWCRVIVGGAVLTEEYANSIGADKYAADAMEAVRYAESL